MEIIYNYQNKIDNLNTKSFQLCVCKDREKKKDKANINLEDDVKNDTCKNISEEEEMIDEIEIEKDSREEKFF